MKCGQEELLRTSSGARRLLEQNVFSFAGKKGIKSQVTGATFLLLWTLFIIRIIS